MAALHQPLPLSPQEVAALVDAGPAGTRGQLPPGVDAQRVFDLFAFLSQVGPAVAGLSRQVADRRAAPATMRHPATRPRLEAMSAGRS